MSLNTEKVRLYAVRDEIELGDTGDNSNKPYQIVAEVGLTDNKPL